jgi:hypothetical protein
LRFALMRALPAGVLAMALVACGPVKVRPDYTLPRALMAPMSAHVGLLLDEQLRAFRQDETRGGEDWQVDLGSGHDKLFRSMFTASFDDLRVFTDLDAARSAPGLQVIFQPRIEQYSFATDKETSAEYWAVTIRYRIAVLAPGGEAIDSLTLTGYGSARSAGGGAAGSLTAATHAAMRDAAAKFLVQMPRQSLAQKLAAGQALDSADGKAAIVDVVEAVPIDPVPAS